MRCLALTSALCLAACGATTASTNTSNGSGGLHGNTSGQAIGGDTGGSTGTPPVPCTTNSDCAVGTCKLAGGGQKFCAIDCTANADCLSSQICNDRGQCVVKPATTTDASAAGGAGAAASTTGVASTAGAASTTGPASTTGTTSTTGHGTTTGPASTTTSTTGHGATTGAGSTTGAASTTGGGACQSGACPSGKACDFATGQCVNASGAGALGSACTSAASCQSGYCQAFGDGTSRCTQACMASAQCPAGFLCYDQGGSGVCVAATGVGGQGVDQSCSADTDCHSTYTCLGSGVCTDTCGLDADCQGTSQAQSDGWICLSAPAGSGRFPYCGADLGPSTHGAAECLDDQSCGGVSGACDLASGFCDMGNGCASDDACRHGMCITSGSRNYCSKPCCGYRDCLAGTTCLPQANANGTPFKACVDTPAGASKGLGAACDPHHPDVCLSGYCMATNPTDTGSTQGYCTSTCCTNADCAYDASEHCVLEANGLGSLMGVCVKR